MNLLFQSWKNNYHFQFFVRSWIDSGKTKSTTKDFDPHLDSKTSGSVSQMVKQIFVKSHDNVKHFAFQVYPGKSHVSYIPRKWENHMADFN